MDIKAFLTEDNHSAEFIAAVNWLDSKIGTEEDAIQAAWVKQYQNMQEFEEKIGNLIYHHAADNGLSADMLMTMLHHLMGEVYANVHGYISDEIITQ